MLDFGPARGPESGVLSDRSCLVVLGWTHPGAVSAPLLSSPFGAPRDFRARPGYAAVKAFRTAAGWFLMTIMYARTAGSGLRLPCSHS